MTTQTPPSLESLAGQVRFLRSYAVFTTAILGVLGLCAAAQGPRREKIDVLDVGRINVVEPDGKVGIVISNRANFPAPVVDGKVGKRSGEPAPGMVFYNGEGDEVGGIVFDGKRSPSGTPSAGGGILFDRYKQDQIVGILYEEGNGRHAAGLHVWDRPDAPLSKLMDRLAEIEAMKTNEEKSKAYKAIEDEGLAGSRRVFVGRSADDAAKLVLSDRKGKPRLVLAVDASGNPSIQLLDENGKLVSEMPKGK